MKKIKILLIDDDQIFLSLTEATLKEVLWLEEVKCVSHAKDAREYLDSCIENARPFPDAIFLDIHMPGIGGMEFAELYCRRYAEQYPATKLVMLSCSIRRKDKAKVMDFPAVIDCMEKPLTEDKLNRLLLYF
jgi:two-component SAPR family response regulator